MSREAYALAAFVTVDQPQGGTRTTPDRSKCPTVRPGIANVAKDSSPFGIGASEETPILDENSDARASATSNHSAAESSSPAVPASGPRQGAPETYPASRIYRFFTGLFVFGPPALLVAAFRGRWLMATPANRRIFGVFYILSGFGITAGYHRLFTHRSFQTTPFIRGVFAVLGSTAIQGSVPDWVADHRKHHAYADEVGDPHSPHVGHKGGRLRGFVHSHFGWLFADEKASRQRYVPDLLEDPVVMAVHRRFAQIVAVSYFVAPFAAGLVTTRRLRGGLSGFLWGGAMRVFFVHHATWSVNSVCHLWGTRPFETRDRSRNNPLVAVVGLGEGNHHNHHAFPRSAKHGLQPWQVDPTWWLIWTMEKTRLAWDVQRVSQRQMELKRVGAQADVLHATNSQKRTAPSV